MPDADPAPEAIRHARQLVRDGRYAEAVDHVHAAWPALAPEHHAAALTCAGLAHYFARRWAEALGYLRAAARDSEVPEAWFNVAMAQVQVGDVEGAHATWQRVFDLSYAHQAAPETSTFFQKKLLFAAALRDAGACDARGLDLLERQLLPFYTTHHITDASFWGLRGVPDFESVLDLIRDYYGALGRTEAEWHALLDGLAGELDEEGRAYCQALRSAWPPGADG